MQNKILHGDCLQLMKDIPDSSVDMILCDLPYGTMKGCKIYDYSNGIKWDNVLDMNILWQEYNRVTRPNANIILFSQEPFSNYLMNTSIRNIPFSYRCIWIKDNFANPLMAKKACVNYYEDILVFGRNKDDFSKQHPLRFYFQKILDFISIDLKEINSILGHRRAEHCFYNSGQFEVCTEKTYCELIDKFSINKMENFLSFSEIKQIHCSFNKPRVFNLPDGKKFKSNVFQYKKDYTGLHPTQKPLALFEDLIKTFSNEGDTVLDNCAGSGTTGVACINTNRNYILMEQEQKYIEIIKNRMQSCKQ